MCNLKQIQMAQYFSSPGGTFELFTALNDICCIRAALLFPISSHASTPLLQIHRTPK